MLGQKSTITTEKFNCSLYETTATRQDHSEMINCVGLRFDHTWARENRYMIVKFCVRGNPEEFAVFIKRLRIDPGTTSTL